MSEFWIENIRACRAIIQANHGPGLVNVVSGSQADQHYWQERLMATRQDIFREDGTTRIISSLEGTRKGNFLGSLNAWVELRKTIAERSLPAVMLMNMVFGMGKRLSPFTQALGNRKPAFPTPLCNANRQQYLATADVAALSATLWQYHLESNGFRGIIIKWGDEAIFPGKAWDANTNQYQDVDGMRFVWQTEPTEDLAREKEWVEFDSQTSQMTHQYTRQGLDSLRSRLSSHAQDRKIGVNLGSLGISYALMEVAEEVFRADISDEARWVDWDPYTWIAFSCRDVNEWQAEAALEDRMGKRGISDLEKRVPDFFQKISQVKLKFQDRYGRLPVIGVLDFGHPYWMDWGLHLSLRRSLETLTADTDLGIASRALFQLPQERDMNGNFVSHSSFPEGADIRNSLLVDTVITDTESSLHGAVVVAGRHHRLEMPHGGCALFCAADEMKFKGSHAVAFKSTGRHFLLEEGDRLATLYLSDGMVEMRSNESIVNYEAENYSLPVMGNVLSFEEASRRMSEEDTRLVEDSWSSQWNNWLR